MRRKRGNEKDGEVKKERISATRDAVREELKGPVSLRRSAVIECVGL